jgi:hypothetical protein
MESRRSQHPVQCAEQPSERSALLKQLTRNDMKIKHYSGAENYNHAVTYPREANGHPAYVKSHYKIVEESLGHATFSMSIGYLFCCGMREIGHFDGPYQKEPFTIDQVKKFREELCDLLNKDYLEAVGAFTLTENIHFTNRRLVPKLWQQLIDTWPNASCSKPFYNPNSGNTIIQWVLPIPGRTAREEFFGKDYDEDEED